MNEQKLAHLVECARKKDNKAFAQLYNIFAENIYYLGLKITGNPDDANDVIQETMLKLYNNLSAIEKTASLKSYILRIAYNSSIDILRRRTPIKDDVDDEQLVAVPDLDEEFIPTAFIEKQELRDELMKKLDVLEHEKKTVLLLKYYQQMSVKEIALQLNVSEKIVESRLYRARNELKKFIDKSRWRELIILGTTIPVLTQLYNLEAKSSFSSTISTYNWTEIGAQIGLPAAVLASTIPYAVGESIAAVSATTASGLVTAKVISIILASALTIGSGTYYYVNSLKGQDASTAKNVSVSTIITQSSNDDVLFDIVPSESSNPPPLDGSENEEPESSTVATTPANDNPVPQNTSYSIIVPNYILTYKLKEEPSIQTIINDSGMEIPENVDLKVVGYDKINFSKPNEYGLVFSGYDKSGEYKFSVAIIVIIE